MNFHKLFFSLILVFSFLKAEDKVINIDTLSSQAKNETKHTIIYFHMTHCPYCKRMQKFVFNNNETETAIKKDFLFVDINIDESEEIVIYKDFKDTKKQFARELHVSFYPTIVFVDENNNIAYVLKGYRSKSTFFNLLNYIKKKRYIDMDFSEYLDELEFKE